MKLKILFTVLVLSALFSYSEVAPEPKIIFEDDATSLTTDIKVVILSGSSSDPIDKVGLSNLTAELMLRGTKKRDRVKFQSELERMGAVLNAHAMQDMVIFDGKVIKERTADFITLLEDCLLNPKFSKTEFDALKTELLAEAAHIKNSNNRMGGITARKELFKGSSLEKPVNGSMGTLKKITLEDVLRHYNNQFHQGNIIFGAASSIKESEMKAPLSKIWRAFPDGARVQLKSIEPKVPLEPKLIVIHKAKTSTGSLLFAQQGILVDDPLRYALAVGNFSYGGEPLVARLFKTIRGELGWTYAIGSTYGAMGQLTKQRGIFVTSSTPSVEFTAKTILKTLEMWKDYMENGLEKGERTLATESMINSYPFEFDSAEKRVALKLSSYVYGVPLLNQEEYEKVIDGISNKDIKNALKARHTERGWLMVLVADKDVVKKQLEEEQKNIAPEKRITISQVITPEEVVN